MIRLWLKGLVGARSGRLMVAAAGVALTVGLLGALGAFIVASAENMAKRAVAGVPVDWQVLVAPGADASAVTKAIGETAAYSALAPVGYADIAGFTATTGDTSQTTGPGKVLGLEVDYRNRFPDQIRLIVGSADGVLIALQTAANLHVSPGDTVTINRVGVASVEVKIAGVIALPNADSMFQAIGVPKGIAPQAPPDNVLLMPMMRWKTIFDPQKAIRPDTVRTEIHVQLARAAFPSDPSAAFIQAQRMANNFEARVAGSAVVGNNLAARLDGVRADALYARVLFLFLGVPGVVLAILVTLAVAASGSDRRRREQALLRTRGASLLQVMRLAGAEAAAIGVVATVLGLALAGTTAIAWWHLANLGIALLWFALAAAVGLVLAIAAFVVPAWRDATLSTVSAARIDASQQSIPLWQRLYVDLAFIIMGAIAFWSAAKRGYEIVLAPEGIAQTSVHYEAFLAPLCLWIGLGLLSVRLSRLVLGSGRRAVEVAIAPISHSLSPLVAASLSRQRGRIARGVALVALAFAFATATAIFNTTYNAQSRVDAELTNGADVTVTGTSAHPAAALLQELRILPGVFTAEPMMHRFAYVGSDLQDIFGINPAHIGKATTLSNAYFANNDAAKTLALLAETPDGILVSQETVNDFQLQSGDRLNLRLQNAIDHQYHVVPFRFLGVAREFPTAPKDSFLVANANYIAERTGSDAAEVVLLRTSASAEKVAAAARRLTTPMSGLKVTTLGDTQAIISSSLTAIDLRGLTTLELGFSVLMIASVTGLILALGLAERQRSFTILSALGAGPAQLGVFLWSEGLIVVIGGAMFGIIAGFGLAWVLVAILSGVFDPPPTALSIPWLYLAVTFATGLVCATVALIGMQTLTKRPDVEMLRGG
jgi:putative ABC transport system permease protein